MFILRRIHDHWRLPMLVLAVALCLAGGCGEEDASSAPGSSSAEPQIETFTASSAIVQPGDTLHLAARVVDDGASPEALADVTVTFGEVGHQTHGTFDPASVQTDAQGWARATYRALPIGSGRVDLKATAGSDVRYLQLLLLPDAPAQAPLAIALTATETALPADGRSTVPITVSVTSSGAPLPVKSVILVAGELFEDRDGDGSFGAGDEIVVDADADGEWDPIGSITSPVVTDASGLATATYTAGVVEGAVFIKATVDSVAADLQLTLHAEQSTVTVEVTPLEVWADGSSEVSVHARVVDSHENPLAGKLVRFTAGEPFTDTDGDGFYSPGSDAFSDLDDDGEWDAMGTITSSCATGSDGSAAAVFRAGYAPGTATIYASTRESRGSAAVRLLALPRVHHAEWEWSPTWLYANGISRAELTLHLFDQNGSPIPGKRVRVVGNDTDTSGVADAEGTLRFSYQAPLVPGTATLMASAEEWVAAIPIEVRALPILLGISLTPERDEIALLNSGGEDRVTFHALCTTLTGSPAPEGMPIQFAITAGPGGDESFEENGAAALTVLTDMDGEARAVLRAGTLPGPVTVTATYGPLARSAQVGITVGPAVSISGRAIDAQLASWEETLVEVTVKDAYGNPVQDGTVVYFEVDEGLIQGSGGLATGRTSGGETEATYYSLGPELGGDGRAEVTAHTDAPGVHCTIYIAIPLADEVVRQLSVVADPAELAVRGEGSTDQTTLIASCFLSPDVPAAAGIPVTFTIMAGPGGGETIAGETHAAIIETNSAGVAMAAFSSGTRSGPVHIEVTAGAAWKNVYLGISSGPAAAVHCWTDPQGAAAGDTVAVIAVVEDAYHNPAANGTVVYFGADEGFIFTDGGSGTAVTDAGVATATYVALLDDPSLQSVTIHCATQGDVECTTLLLLEVPVNPEDPGAVARIELVPSLTEIAVRETGWTEQCALSATAYDAHSVPVGSGREITFEIDAGPDGGENLEGQGWGPVAVLTDAQGRAQVTLGSGTVPGTIRIEARAGDLVSRSALVSIAAGPPVHISMGVDPLNVRGWDVVGAEAAVTAFVSDAYNNPVGDGTTLYFTCDEGIIRGSDGNLGSAVTAGGVAQATYFSGLPRDDGRVEIRASTAGGTVNGTAGLICSGPPATVEFIAPAPPAYLPADGESELRVTVEVLDQNANFVLAGTRVEFESTHGIIDESAVTADGVYGSIARATLRSATLGRDASWTTPDDGIGAIAYVSASAGLGGAASDALAVAFTTSAAYRANSRIEIEASVPASSAVPFEVLVRDRFGNPLGGHALQLSVSGGGTVTASGTTDAWGTAGPLIFTAPPSDTTCVITAVDADPTYGGLTLSTQVSVQ